LQRAQAGRRFASESSPPSETVRIQEGKISRIRLFLEEQAALEAAGLRE
jgi:hypothetical protein